MTGRAGRAAAALLTGSIVLLAGCAAAPPAEETRRLGNLTVQGVPPVPATLEERLRRYRNTRDARVMGWLGDSLMVSTRFGNTRQLHRVDRPKGARRQMTFFDEPVAAARVAAREAPGGFVYLRDTGGSEFFQLYWYDLESGESRLLSDGSSRYINVVWDNDGERFAYTTTERNGRDWDIHLRDPDGGARVALEAGGAGWLVEDFAPDDRHLLVSRYVSINESHLYELSLEDGSLTPLLQEAPTMAVGQARYTPDGSGVLFTSDMGAEFLRLHRLDLASGEVDVLTADIPWNVETFEVSPDGEHLAFAVNEDGYSRLYLWHLPEYGRVALPEVPRGMVSDLTFHPGGRRLAFSLSQPTAPTDVYSLDLDRRTGSRWTESEVGGLPEARFVAPELVRYPTFDSVDGAARRIPAFVYRPDDPGQHPVLVAIHGGPEAQYRPYFSSSLQYYVNELGMAVVAPNVRGSAGYGKSYLKLDDGRRREDAVRDIGALLDWISVQPDLDADRVVVSGGSYGGYMVLASLVHYSDRLAAGVERVGISNFVTFLTNTEDYRRNLRRAEYGDERDPDMRAFLEGISPLTRVDDIARPLLIMQGANDPRVPASESEQIFEALRANDVPAWYVLAGDEGHGFRKKTNRDFAAAATALFLERFVLEGAP
ncbi:MAG: S9 family peptidase [Pseudomonadota bacterium]